MVENDKHESPSRATTGVNRRGVLQGIGAVGAASVLGYAGSAAAQEGGRLQLAQVKSPLEFDPIVLNDVPSAQVADRIFDGLYTYDSGTQVVPEMATDMPEVSNDGQTYEVGIREEATFQNGDPVTAEDVKHSFEAPVAEETENASEFNMIDTVEVIDEKTARFQLKFPFGPFMNTLTQGIVPKSVRTEDKEAFNTQNPVGAGPFEFVEWQQGSFVRLERWDDYWGEPMPNLAEVEMVPVEEPTTRITSIRTGENDVIEEIPPKLWAQTESMNNVSINDELGIGYFYLAFNANEGPTTDPKVREAIDYTFSMDQAISNFVEPTGERQYSPIPRPVAEEWDFPIEEWKQMPHDKDIEQAQQLFDEAGVADDWEARIIVPPDDKREQLGLTVANGIEEAGFGANVQRFDWGKFLDTYVTGDADQYNMYTLGWAGVPDPNSFMFPLFSTGEDALGVTNGTFYENEEMNEKIVNARQSADRDERRDLYIDAINTVLQDRVHLPAYNLKNSFGVRSEVSDFDAHPVSSFRLVSDSNNVSIGN
jgi:peptide/nickel transport system substrate-binding protein